MYARDSGAHEAFAKELIDAGNHAHCFCTLMVKACVKPSDHTAHACTHANISHRTSSMIESLKNRLQIVEGLRASHATGIVHRDVKPQNVIVCGEDQCTKMIDLGAAADLRVGINYVPNEFLLDPRYAPPEQYIMSTQVLLLAMTNMMLLLIYRRLLGWR